MPTYCYRDAKTGEPFEAVMTIKEVSSLKTVRGITFLPTGRRGRRDYSRELRQRRDENVSIWPQVCQAAGVNPLQRKEAYEASVSMGVPTQFDERGDAIFTSREHRRKYLRARGMCDFDAGYGDHAPDGVLDRKMAEAGISPDDYI